MSIQIYEFSRYQPLRDYQTSEGFFCTDNIFQKAQTIVKSLHEDFDNRKCG